MHMIQYFGHDGLQLLKRRVIRGHLIEKFGVAFTENGRNDHVTMVILHLPLAVLSSQ